MKRNKYCFTFRSYNKALEIINISNEIKIIPIFFFRYTLVNGLGVDWLMETIEMLKEKFGNKKIEFYVDVKKNYGIFINLVEKKINYIKVQADNKMIKKLNEIAKLNKVLINPKFSILDKSSSKKKITRLKKNLK